MLTAGQPRVDRAWLHRSKLASDEPLSNFASDFNLRQYSVALHVDRDNSAGRALYAAAGYVLVGGEGDDEVGSGDDGGDGGAEQEITKVKGSQGWGWSFPSIGNLSGNKGEMKEVLMVKWLPPPPEGEEVLRDGQGLTLVPVSAQLELFCTPCNPH